MLQKGWFISAYSTARLIFRACLLIHRTKGAANDHFSSSAPWSSRTVSHQEYLRAFHPFCARLRMPIDPVMNRHRRASCLYSSERRKYQFGTRSGSRLNLLRTNKRQMNIHRLFVKISGHESFRVIDTKDCLEYFSLREVSFRSVNCSFNETLKVNFTWECHARVHWSTHTEICDFDTYRSLSMCQQTVLGQ